MIDLFKKDNILEALDRIYKLPPLRKNRMINKEKNKLKNNNLLEKKLNKSYRRKINNYWKTHYGKKIKLFYHTAYKNVTEKKDPRVIPQYIWREEICPFFNDLWMRTTYKDKNLADVLLNGQEGPSAIVKMMNGHYYNEDHELISENKVKNKILSGPKEQIIKSSQTDNAVGIKKLKINDGKIIFNDEIVNLEHLEKIYGPNFIIQPIIEQHPDMAKPHDSSVNTIRMTTFRWEKDIKILLAFVRIGTGYKITDNMATEGVACCINNDGKLSDKAVDKWGKIYFKHPTTGFSFSELNSIPGYYKICEKAIRLHKQIFHFDIISWDFILSKDEKPIFLEMNFLGDIGYRQLACEQPFFGDLTEEVLEKVKNSSEKPSRPPQRSVDISI